MAITLRSYRYRKSNGKGNIHESVKTVLVDDSGRKWLYVLMMTEGGLTVLRVSKTEVQYMREVIQTKKIASMTTIIRRLRDYGRRMGVTKAAKLFLRKASAAQL